MRTYLFVAMVLLGLTEFVESTTDDLHREEFIKDHSTEIANIVKNFNIIIKLTPPKIAGGPFVPPVVCIISKEELEEIWKEIERDESEELGHPANFQYSENCNELEKIKTGILKLKYEFKQLLEESVSSVKYDELKASYEEKMRLLIKRLDEEKKTAEGEHLENIRQLQDDLQKQQDEINRILKQLELEQEKLHEAYVRLCVSYISQNEIQAASDVFKNITKPSTMERIVDTSYSNSADNFENIILLLRRIGDDGAVEIGYRCLYDKLSADNRLSKMYGIILANEIQNRTSEVTVLMNKLLYKMVTQRQLDGFIDYANTRGSSRDVIFVKEVAPMLVRKIYVNTPIESFGNATVSILYLVDFQRKLKNEHHRWYIMVELIRMMNSYGHQKSLFLILNDAIILREQLPGDTFVIPLINEFEKQLPENLRIFLSSTACIKNLESGEFLEISEPGPFFDYSVTTSPTLRLDGAQVKFRVREDGLANIINAKSDKYLAVSYGFGWLGRIGVAATQQSSDTFFELKMLGTDRFTIKETYSNEYLYPIRAPFGSLYHGFITGTTPSIINDVLWFIKDCSSF